MATEEVYPKSRRKKYIKMKTASRTNNKIYINCKPKAREYKNMINLLTDNKRIYECNKNCILIR